MLPDGSGAPAADVGVPSCCCPLCGFGEMDGDMCLPFWVSFLLPGRKRDGGSHAVQSTVHGHD